MLKTKKLIAILFVLFYCSISFAQKLDFTNPEAYSFMKYVEQPVDMYHGRPTITVPIYIIKLQDFEFPVYLSYHSGGIKVSEEASEVGLGWTLNAYGVITQQVNDKDDLYFTNSYVSDWPIPLHNFEIQGVLTYHPGYYPQFEGLSSEMCSEIGPQFYLKNAPVNLEADIFSYNFGSFSGTFFYDFIGKKFIDTKDPSILITYNKDGEWFQIIDKYSNKYIFKARQRNNASAEFLYGGSSFYLTRIETYHNEVISFEFYNRETLTDRISSVLETYRSGDKVTPSANGLHYTESVANYYPMEIKKITFPNNGSIEFNRSDRIDLKNTTKIDAIEINKGTVPFQKYTFDYSYFISTSVSGYFIAGGYGNFTNDQLNKRLKLNSVTKVGEKPYVFSYYENEILPNKSSHGVDFWGYYNGIETNGQFLPSLKYLCEAGNLLAYSQDVKPIYDIFFTDGAERRFNKKYAQACMLTRIQYPTGGYRQFIFEPNTYKDSICSGFNLDLIPITKVIYDQNLTSSRSKSVTIDFDKRTKVNIKMHFRIPVNSTQCVGSTDYYCGIIEHASTGTYRKTWYIDDLTLESYSNGKNYFTGETNVILEPGTYTFNTELCDNYIRPSIPPSDGLYPEVYMELSYYSGLVSPEEQAGAGFRIKEISTSENQAISYAYTEENSDKSSGQFNAPPVFFRNVGSYILVHKANGPLSFCVSENSTLSNVWEFYSDNRYNSNVTYSRVVQSIAGNGSTIYNFNSGRDFLNSSAPIHIPSIESSAKNGSVCTMEIRDNNNITRLKKIYEYCLSNEKKIFNAHFEQNEFSPDYCEITDCDMYIWKTSASNLELVSETSEEYFDNALPLTKVTDYTYDDYLNLKSKTTKDSKGQIIEERFYYPGSGVLNEGQDRAVLCAMTDRNMISLPVLEQTKISNNVVYSKETVYSSVGSGKFYLPTIVRQYKNPESQSVTDILQYDSNGKLVSAQKEDDTPTSYFWGYENQYPVAKIEGITYSQIESNTILKGFLSQLQNYSKLTNETTRVGLKSLNINIRSSIPTNVRVTTYTYDPLIGMTSQTDPNGVTTYYEYDDSGRLKYIKDYLGNILKEYEYHFKN
jgi:YD repeat-containing protein